MATVEWPMVWNVVSMMDSSALGGHYTKMVIDIRTPLETGGHLDRRVGGPIGEARVAAENSASYCPLSCFYEL